MTILGKTYSLFIKNAFAIVMICMILLRLIAPNVVFCQTYEASRVLILFDVSKSMIAKYESGTRMDAAKKMAGTLIDDLAGKTNLQIALRVYGAVVEYPQGDCTDSKLVIPFSVGNSLKIKSYISDLKPTGITPIAYSLEQAINDFPAKGTKNFIVIITDGIEECGGDICKAALKLEAKGITLRPFIIGIGLSVEQSHEFECIGNYFNADYEFKFADLSRVIISQILNPTTAQINLLDSNGLPTETNVPMILYNAKDNIPDHYYIHTLNQFKNPDTLYLDAYRKYHIQVGTIPNVEIDSAVQSLGKHNVFAVNAAQGVLRLVMNTPMQGSEPQCIVRKKENMQTINYQKMNTSEKYLCGVYDLEIMTYPKIIMKDIKITQHGSTIEIPACGLLQIHADREFIGSILTDKKIDNELVCNLPPEGTMLFNLFLQPGNYILVFKEKKSKYIIDSATRKISVKERGYTNLTL